MRPDASRHGPLALGAGLFVVSWAALHLGALSPFEIVDTPLYQRYGEAVLAGSVPYRDLALEYPPGALAAFVVPALASGGAYREVFELLMLALGLCLVAACWLTLQTVGASRARIVVAMGLTGIAPLLLGPVVLTRFDLLPAACVAGALCALVHDRGRLALALLAIAATAKLYALVLLPIALLEVRARRGTRDAALALGAFVVVAGAIVLPFAAVAPTGLLDALRRQTERPLQLESFGSSLLLAADWLGVYEPTVVQGFGSQDLDGDAADVLASVTTIVQVVAVLAVIVAFARRAGRSSTHAALLTAFPGAVACFVAFGKVLSPQFLIWLIGLAALAGGRLGAAALGLFASALVLTHGWFPSAYWDLVALDRPEVALLAARNAGLIALAGVLIAALVLVPRARRS